MLVGHADQITPSVIGGWAADTDAPGTTVSVVIYVDGRRLDAVACDRERPDLHVRGDLQGQVQHGFRYEISPPLDFNQIAQISVRFISSGEVLPDGKREGRRRNNLSPILVTAPGRSGTTFLMNQLSQSRKICLVELSPFETRLLAYWASVYRTLTAGADFERSTHPDQPAGDGFHIGSNPYSHQTYDNAFAMRPLAAEYFNQFIPDATADFIRTAISEYYMRLGYDQGKYEAEYFAEKANSLHRSSRDVSRTLYPNLKEIVILRDPRDIFCSHVAYFRRGADSAFTEISNSSQELLRIWRGSSGREVFLKYEDMIYDRPGLFGKLSGFLGIADFGQGDPAKERAVFQVHATSKSPTDSVGRWKNLPAEDIRRCNAAWGEFLDQFGYEQ